ncbi:MAG: ATP-binding protein [Leptolyngbyaceae cyanobacterium bins.59]|nr:ATP-binding protein [Leptolyngbyaceae cyanobacterium bins.59]
MSDALVPETIAPSYQALAQELETLKQQVNTLEKQLQKTKAVSISTQSLQSSLDRIQQALCEIIHDREQAVTQLSQSEARFQKLATNVPGMIYCFQINPDGSSRFSYVSAFSKEIYGLEPEELIQKDGEWLMTTIHPDDRERFHRSVTLSAKTLQPWIWEGRVMGVTGTMKWTRAISRPERWETGTIVWDGILLDISEEKEAEDLQTRLMAMLDATPDFVGASAPDGTVLYVNSAGLRMTGFPEDVDIRTLKISDFNSEAAMQRFATEIIPIAIEQGIWQGEATVCTRSGKEIPVSQVIIAHKAGDGTVEFLSTIIRDISERRAVEAQLREYADRQSYLYNQSQAKGQALEEALLELQRTQAQLVQSEKMSSLGQLVAGVAHEINNPVNFIYGNLSHAHQYTQDLLDLLNLYQTHYPNPHPVILDAIETIDLEFLVEDLPRLINSMKVGSDRIQKIVASLRTFSRMDEAEYKAVDLHEGLESTLMILQNRLKPRPDHPTIVVHKEYGKLPLIECYAGQLNQVFMNILVNALDALEEQANQFKTVNSESGAFCPLPIITIRTEVVEGDRVLIHIADTGPGIPEEALQRLFDPFFTTKPVGKGTGMGLSISYQIITERHNGNLYCRSVVGQGSEFIIEIPIRQAKL